jgi:hypothetical protein
MSVLGRLAALDRRVLPATYWEPTAKRLVKRYWILYPALALVIGLPLAVVRDSYLFLVMFGFVFPAGQTALVIAQVGWAGLKADVPLPRNGSAGRRSKR